MSLEEQNKCFEWSQNINRYRAQYRSAGLNNNFGQFGQTRLDFTIRCHQANDKDQCMNLLGNGRVHLVTLDPGEIFIGGRYYSLVPIVAERYGTNREAGYFSVAVVKRISAGYIQSPLDLFRKRACFPGVGQMGGWVLPMSHLLESDVVLVRDCNNIVKTAATFFNQSCAPNALIDKHNPTGDNPTSMCSLCRGKCSGSDTYSNYDGALRCLIEEGDVAFLKHTTVDMTLRHMSHSRQNVMFSKADVELLCPISGRAAIDNYQGCNWGFVPAHAVVTLSSVPPYKRQQIQNFLIENANIFGNAFFGRARSSFNRSSTFGPGRDSFGHNRDSFTHHTNLGDFQTNFTLFGDNPGPMNHQKAVNLLFSDETTMLVPISDNKQTFRCVVITQSVCNCC